MYLFPFQPPIIGPPPPKVGKLLALSFGIDMELRVLDAEEEKKDCWVPAAFAKGREVDTAALAARLIAENWLLTPLVERSFDVFLLIAVSLGPTRDGKFC